MKNQIFRVFQTQAFSLGCEALSHPPSVRFLSRISPFIDRIGLFSVPERAINSTMSEIAIPNQDDLVGITYDHNSHFVDEDLTEEEAVAEKKAKGLRWKKVTEYMFPSRTIYRAA